MALARKLQIKDNSKEFAEVDLSGKHSFFVSAL
jgi:hypothetical protein